MCTCVADVAFGISLYPHRARQQTYGARGAQKPHGCVPGPGGSCAATGATQAGRARRQSLSQLKSQHALAAQARREQEAARQREVRPVTTTRLNVLEENSRLIALLGLLRRFGCYVMQCDRSRQCHRSETRTLECMPS